MIDSAPPASPQARSINPSLTRRGLFRIGGASAALAASPLAASNFGTGFTHSVASGEPGPNRVMLWTRYLADAETTLTWEVSDTQDFARVVSEGSAIASPARDFCAKIWAEGLEPGQWYYYRFVAPDGTISDIGRTRTLPEGSQTDFRMAVFSCSNFGFGYFNAYGHAAQVNDVDLAVHLGDYIYEYPRGTYPGDADAHPSRTLWPNNEIVTLADYRLRYATYRADPDLRRLHQVVPMISIWDDHESTNDSWKDGAQNHQPDTEGEWSVRKAIAKQVYREWMPVSDEPYAQYDIGNLATLFRLDTRLEGREEQFSFGKILEGSTTPEAAMEALTSFRDGAYTDPERQLLGSAQEQWLAEGLVASKARGATWQVLVQQVLIGKLSAAENLMDMAGDDLPDWLRQRLASTALASAVGLPLNMDAWDGYPAARERLFKAALEADANLLVMAGDTHNAWAFDLAHDGANVGVEFGTASVSSPGLDGYLSSVNPEALAAGVVSANPELQWADTSRRGYMMIELTPTRATTEYRFTASVRERSSEVVATHRMATLAGSKVLEG